MAHALWFFIETAGSLLATAFLMRAAVWWVQLPARNPLVQFVIALTDWLVKPLRRLVRASGRADWASLAAAMLVAVLLAAMRVFAFGAPGRAPAFGVVVLLAVFWLLKWALYCLNTLVILQAVLSWVNPHAPIAPVIERLTDPFLAPIRRVIPTIGGVDVSPLVLIVVTQLALMIIESIFISLVPIV